jgi:membrane-bound metal-dependent hydrolase YbcI (DUF457 family)
MHEPRERCAPRMADFKTHIATSTVLGVAYGYVGWERYGFSVESCLLAGGLCSVSGMLPDLDSDSGVPIREATSLASAVVPMLLVDRLREFNLSPEGMVVAAGAVYVFIRFVVAKFFRHYTVHRGMWHSIPACVSVGLLAYLLMHCQDDRARLYKSGAVATGFLIHLILDEIWAVDFRGGRFRLKSSFGTALKFFGQGVLANVSVYAKLALLSWLVWYDHQHGKFPNAPEMPQNWSFPMTAESLHPPAPQFEFPNGWR